MQLKALYTDITIVKPYLHGDLSEGFRRYAKIVDSGSNPAAKLIIEISFKHLGLKYKVPTLVVKL